MSFLDAILKVSTQFEAAPQLDHYPELERLRQEFLRQSRETLSRLVPDEVAALEHRYGWAASYERQMQVIADRLLTGSEDEKAVISKAEMRKRAPSFGKVIDALKARPQFLIKVAQGFTEVNVVPFGLSPYEFKDPIASALREYDHLRKLHSTDGELLDLDTNNPVWMWDHYEHAERNGSIVYFPRRLDYYQYRVEHGGKSKIEVLSESPQDSVGWMVMLQERLPNIPRKDQGQTIADRRQIEANMTPELYLALLQATPYTLEQYLPPEARLSEFLVHLTATEGQILYDHQANDGTAEFCLGAYFPSSGRVPFVCWSRNCAQMRVVWEDNPSDRRPDAGARSAVRVI